MLTNQPRSHPKLSLLKSSLKTLSRLDTYTHESTFLIGFGRTTSYKASGLNRWWIICSWALVQTPGLIASCIVSTRSKSCEKWEKTYVVNYSSQLNALETECSADGVLDKLPVHTRAGCILDRSGTFTSHLTLDISPRINSLDFHPLTMKSITASDVSSKF